MTTDIRLLVPALDMPDNTFDSIPAPAISSTTLNICLKCAFDLFTGQLKLAPRTAYVELRKHVPEEPDFTGAATVRPHFFDQEGLSHCPYCKASKRWFAHFCAIRIEAHSSFEKARKKLWAALKKDPGGFTLWSPEHTQMEIFTEWLDRLRRRVDINGEAWLLEVAIEYLKRFDPVANWDEVAAKGVRRVQHSREIEGGWQYADGKIYVSPSLYGDILLVQHLLSRSHAHGGRTFEGRLTLHELIGRLRRAGYFHAKGIDAQDAYEALEQAVAAIVASGPLAVYYAVDRRDYLKQLKSIYEKKHAK